ncbi:MAG TPA: hypothetical protein VIH86_16305 [Puia sp.]
MRYTILLNRDEKTKAVEAQEQARFIKAILEALDILPDWNPDESLTIDSKIKFRKDLNTYNIHIADDADGGLKIYANNEVIGEWKKSKYILKTDRSQIDPNKKLYLEMHIDFWSIFEESNVKTN